MNPINVLIIGAHGMLGQDLVREFKDEIASSASPPRNDTPSTRFARSGNNKARYDVTGWGREDLDIANNPTRDSQTKKRGILRQSISNGVQEKVLELKPEIIINAAAYNNVDGAETEIELANKVNGYAPGYLAEAAKELGALFIQYSTDYVFDGEKEGGYKEDDRPNPISAYGRSKFIGEQAVLNSGLEKYYLIRVSRLFGKYGSSPSAKKSFIDRVIEMARPNFKETWAGKAQTKDKLEFVNDTYFSSTYTPDLAKATRELIEAQKPAGIYHLTNSGVCTYYQLAKETLAILGKDVKIIPVSSERFPRPAKIPKYSVLLNTKLPLLRDWKEALEEYLKT